MRVSDSIRNDMNDVTSNVRKEMNERSAIHEECQSQSIHKDAVNEVAENLKKRF